MNPLFILILVAIITLIIIGFKFPAALTTSSFSFTRGCLGIAILTFGASILCTQRIPPDEDWFRASLLLQIPSWLFLIFVFRGIFEVLSDRKLR